MLIMNGDMGIRLDLKGLKLFHITKYLHTASFSKQFDEKVICKCSYNEFCIKMQCDKCRDSWMKIMMLSLLTCSKCCSSWSYPSVLWAGDSPLASLPRLEFPWLWNMKNWKTKNQISINKSTSKLYQVFINCNYSFYQI